MRRDGIDFSDYLWDFVGGAPIQNEWEKFKDAPVQSPESEALSKDLKKRGFKFVGPVILYAFMQAVGMINDHSTDCHAYADCREKRRV
jgi:DNA-3-methyladenine glycosylase I